jgi:hypothetical protein
MAVITKVYGGRAIISFNEVKHYYTVSVPSLGISKLYQPGVTTVIGKGLDKSKVLVPWAVGEMANCIKRFLRGSGSTTFDIDSIEAIVDLSEDEWENTKQKAADIGSLVHRVLYEKLMGNEPKLPVVADPILAPNLTEEMVAMANNSIAAGLKFLDDRHIKVLQAEQPRWSPTYGFVGTGDLIAEIDGKLSVLDWKTGKRLYSTVFLQLAAYQQAYQEEFPGEQIEQRVAVNIGRDGELDSDTRDNSTFQKDLKQFLNMLDTWRWDRENQGKWSKSAPPLLTPDQLGQILATNI